MHIRDTLYIRQIKHMNGYMTLPSDYDLGEREGGLQRPGPLLWRAIGEASRPKPTRRSPRAASRPKCRSTRPRACTSAYRVLDGYAVVSAG